MYTPALFSLRIVSQPNYNEPEATQMARAVSEKTDIIRKAIQADPKIGNTELAAKLSAEHAKIKFTPQDIANQKTVLKKAKGQTRKRTVASNGRASHRAAQKPASPATSGTAQASSQPVELIKQGAAFLRAAGSVEDAVAVLRALAEVKV